MSGSGNLDYVQIARGMLGRMPDAYMYKQRFVMAQPLVGSTIGGKRVASVSRQGGALKTSAGEDLGFALTIYNGRERTARSLVVTNKGVAVNSTGVVAQSLVPRAG